MFDLIMNTLRNMFLCVLLSALLSGCGMAPLVVAHRRDVTCPLRNPFVNTKQIYITSLPVGDYHLLRRFSFVQEIRMFDADDSKLSALQKVAFLCVKGISLRDGQTVSDDGVRSILQINGISWLDLSNTSITDKSLFLLADTAKIKELAIVNCHNVTFAGIKSVVASCPLVSFDFSSNGFTTTEILEIMRELTHVKWLTIHSSHGSRKINVLLLEKYARQRNFHLIVY